MFSIIKRWIWAVNFGLTSLVFPWKIWAVFYKNCYLFLREAINPGLNLTHLCNNLALVSESWTCIYYCILNWHILCLDTNECNQPRKYHHCSQNCVNTQGSYYCTCKKGFLLSANGRTCRGRYLKDWWVRDHNFESSLGFIMTHFFSNKKLLFRIGIA